MKKKSSKAVRYNKWGYIFLIPFILVYVVFQLIPLFNTIYNSFFENYLSGLTQIGPNFVGLENYKTLFTQGDIWIYAKNTMILWIMCFVPQIILSLLLGAWFSDVRLKLKGSRFFKTVIYLPNQIMASASYKGAEELITACPLCMYNLRNNGTKEGLPVTYFTELLAEALGIKEEVQA